MVKNPQTEANVHTVRLPRVHAAGARRRHVRIRAGPRGGAARQHARGGHARLGEHQCGQHIVVLHVVHTHHTVPERRRVPVGEPDGVEAQVCVLHVVRSLHQRVVQEDPRQPGTQVVQRRGLSAGCVSGRTNRRGHVSLTTTARTRGRCRAGDCAAPGAAAGTRPTQTRRRRRRRGAWSARRAVADAGPCAASSCYKELEPAREKLPRGSLGPRHSHGQMLVLVARGLHTRVESVLVYLAAADSLVPPVEPVVEPAPLQQGR